MAQEPNKNESGSADERRVAARSPVTAEQFAIVTSSMSRFLNQLAGFSGFQEANVGIAEWTLLNALAKGEGGSNKQLVRDLGVSKQRVNQLVESLKKSAFVEVTSDVGDARKGVVALTSSGRAQLIALNAKLTDLLVGGLRGKERSLHMAEKSLRSLMRVVNEAATPADEAALTQKVARKEGRAAVKGAAKMVAANQG